MKYYNLVYVQHPEYTMRAYLFSLPMDMAVKTGERLCVRDRRGEHIVTAFCDNWICTEKMTKVLCEANGGYFPPAKVIGTVQKVTVIQEMVQKFPEYSGEEMPF